MKRVKKNGMLKKLPPPPYLGRERNIRDEPTAFINILSNIVGIYMER